MLLIGRKAPKLEGDKHFDLPKIMLKVQSNVGKMNDGCWTKETGLLLDLIGHVSGFSPFLWRNGD